MISLKKITGLFSESAARYFSQHEGGRPSPMREIFSDIYRTGAWEGTESVSGPGSSVEAASSFRGEIPKVLRDLGARSLLDAPCGDFNRMKELRLNVGTYTGVDVVPEIVERNISNHAGPGVTFLTLDITRARLPRGCHPVPRLPGPFLARRYQGGPSESQEEQIPVPAHDHVHGVPPVHRHIDRRVAPD